MTGGGLAGGEARVGEVPWLSAAGGASLHRTRFSAPKGASRHGALKGFPCVVLVTTHPPIGCMMAHAPSCLLPPSLDDPAKGPAHRSRRGAVPLPYLTADSDEAPRGGLGDRDGLD